MYLGLRTVVHPAPDLAAATAWFTGLLGVPPYFEQPFYVGYQVGGYELGLDPNADPALGTVAYWGVDDGAAEYQRLLDAGAEPVAGGELHDVGEGIRVATVRAPDGSVLGIIENPDFALPDEPLVGNGPGR